MGVQPFWQGLARLGAARRRDQRERRRRPRDGLRPVVILDEEV
jgi:hypothetical protein